MILPPNFQDQINEIEQKLSEAQAHELREQQFAEEANERFTKNLAAFEQYYPDVFKAIQEFQPREDFCLHVTKSGHGNFVPKGKEAPLYGDNPVEQARLQVEKAVKNPTLTLTEYTRYNPLSRDERIHIRYMQTLGQYMLDLKESGEPQQLLSLPEQFPTGVIFGLGLGYQLPELLSHTKFDYLFIIEPDFEVFFASLFCINWTNIVSSIDQSNGCLFLHLGANKQELINDLNTVVEDIGAFSVVRSFCYQHYSDETLSDLVNKFFKDYFRFQFGFGFYNDAITGLAHTYHLVNKKVPFYDAKNDPLAVLSKVPIFIIGNGPSLDEAEEYIKENSQTAIIFACGSALGSLTSMGVKADFHILVERPYRNYQAVLDMASKETYKDLNLLALNTVYPDTVDLYAWSGLALKGNESATDYINIMLALHGKNSLASVSYSNPLVANAGLSLALNFGFQNIHLFGVDNGTFNKEHHSKYSIYDDNKNTKFRYFPNKVGDHVLEGNFGGSVTSNSVYSMSVKQLEDLIEYKPGAHIVNVGQGAKVRGTVASHANELEALDLNIDKKVVIDLIKNQFSLLPFDDVDEKKLGIDKAYELVCSLKDIASKKYSTVLEANELLKRQQRYLYAFRGTIFSHIFQLFKGTLLYYHCPMLTVLYKYENSDDCLKIFSELNILWINYLDEIASHLLLSATDKCDWAFYNVKAKK
ncbi:motility associated factor glycosyltransferase family protein [Pseudoalteromonas sp. SWN29]|uniref:motility associated factor glycosyltransferase family protein n=1 Tax=Pseudoalteromonas sp. SWN29 TaxID=2792064 RepID=UPI0018CEFF9C|nr:6-hydroxymethylpterin diphosphokinase MptE-like protein [Pseudoalteromonas sp. SWN29]MBH0028554.1 motility associated factor glycosyltransferase family protein [Pseudoalteromonas sp. SWN29]